jgi:maltose/moltooligosaccharide transporter
MAAFEAAEKSKAGQSDGFKAGFWKTVAQLGLVQFFTWFALFTMWTFTNSAVTSEFYGVIDPAIQVKAFNQGSDWTNIGWAVFNGIAAIFGFIIPLLANRIGRKYTHALCLALGTAGYLSFQILPHPAPGTNSITLFLPFALLGIAWSSILSMPYAMLSSAIPANRMGFFMGFFNFFICLPQIFAALGGLNFLKDNLFGVPAINAMYLAGSFMALAAILSLTVNELDGGGRSPKWEVK